MRISLKFAPIRHALELTGNGGVTYQTSLAFFPCILASGNLGACDDAVMPWFIGC